MADEKKLLFNRLGEYLTHSEPNNRKWNNYLTERINGTDENFPIVRQNKKQIKRIEIFSSLWEQISVPLALKFSIKIDDSNTEWPLIRTGYLILALTEILAYLLSDRKTPNIATKKRDPNLRLLNKYLKSICGNDGLAKIKFSNEIEAYYSNCNNSILEISQTQMELIQKLESLIKKVEGYNDLESVLITWAALGVKELRNKTKYKKASKEEALAAQQMFKTTMRGIYSSNPKEFEEICNLDLNDFQERLNSSKIGFTDEEIKKLVICAVTDLNDAGYDCPMVDSRMKNVLAQKIKDDYMFTEGPIVRTKTPEIKMETDMENRYPDKK